MKKIITTVGTSLITNAIEKDVVKKGAYEQLFSKNYSQTKDSSLSQYISTIKKGLDEYIKSYQSGPIPLVFK